MRGCGEQVTDEMMMGILLNGVSSGSTATTEALRCQCGLALDTLKEELMGAVVRKLLEGRALDVRGCPGNPGVQKPNRVDKRRCYCCGQVGHLKAQCSNRAQKTQKIDSHNGRCLAVAEDKQWGSPRAVRFETFCFIPHVQ